MDDVRRLAGRQAAEALGIGWAEARRGGTVQLADPTGHPAWTWLEPRLRGLVVRGDHDQVDDPGPPPPVDLPALPRGGVPPWEPGTDGIASGIAWLTARHPERVMDASAWLDHPAGVIAAGALANEGWRVVGTLPAMLDVAGYRQALTLVGARRQPLILTGAAALIESLIVPGWFAAAGSDPGECAAILAGAVAHEWPTLIGVATGGSAWPGGAYEPGTGRWLRPGAGETLEVTAAGAAAALATDRPVWQRTSLAPPAARR